jgi:hypothetical protein
VKKSRNLRCYAQKPSKLPQSCPTCWDVTFTLERIGPLAAISIIVFYLLILYLLALPNIPENSFASIYSESLIKTTCQHLLLLIGFDTLIYPKYYDIPPILVGHHWGPTIYCSKQNKRKLKAKIKTLQEKRIVYEAIKI